MTVRRRGAVRSGLMSAMPARAMAPTSWRTVLSCGDVYKIIPQVLEALDGRAHVG